MFSSQLAASGNSHPAIEKLLQATETPDGVVFELLSWDEDTWQWAAPLIVDYRNQLKQRFPDIDIAIVSHGGEQFQLTQEKAEKQPEAIATLRGLTDEGVSLHVCGVHSSWEDVAESEYIDIVDVAPSGPARINDYVNLGYTKILIRKPSR